MLTACTPGKELSTTSQTPEREGWIGKERERERVQDREGDRE